MDNKDDMTIEDLIVLRAVFSLQLHNAVMRKDKQKVIAIMNTDIVCLDNMVVMGLTCLDFDIERVYNDYNMVIHGDLSWAN